LFREIRKALIDEFRDIGEPKLVLMDFEVAAHLAMEEVFPEWTVKTCLFHFVKSVKGQSKKKVLKSIRKKREFKQWLEQIFGKFNSTF